MSVDLSFMDSYQEEYEPQTATNLPLLENIPDGSYDCTILSAIITETKNSRQPILKCMIQFDTLNQSAEKAYFLKSPENINRLAGDLKTLGFTADKWKKDCKLSQEITKAVAEMPGLRFKGTKKASKPTGPDGKIYHNLYVNAALEPSANAAQLRSDNTAKQSVAGNGESDSVPF